MPEKRPPVGAIRPPTPRDSFMNAHFREEQRARRHPKDAQVIPGQTDNAARQKTRNGRAHKTERQKTVEEERPIAAAIALKYHILGQKQDTAHRNPNEARALDEDLELIQAIIPGLKDEPENDVYRSDLHMLQKKYGVEG